VSYRPFIIAKSQSAPATVATVATLQGEAARSVANVATVAALAREIREREGQTVASVATVAREPAKAENPAALDPRLHFCACGEFGPFGVGWSPKSPERAQWFCAACVPPRENKRKAEFSSNLERKST
jgi:hypothetical protein